MFMCFNPLLTGEVVPTCWVILMEECAEEHFPTLPQISRVLVR
jgi:hypothetical protein